MPAGLPIAAVLSTYIQHVASRLSVDQLPASFRRTTHVHSEVHTQTCYDGLDLGSEE